MNFCACRVKTLRRREFLTCFGSPHTSSNRPVLPLEFHHISWSQHSIAGIPHGRSAELCPNWLFAKGNKFFIVFFSCTVQIDSLESLIGSKYWNTVYHLQRFQQNHAHTKDKIAIDRCIWNFEAMVCVQLSYCALLDLLWPYQPTKLNWYYFRHLSHLCDMVCERCSRLPSSPKSIRRRPHVIDVYATSSPADH